MNTPDEFYYSAAHSWICLEGDIATVGITDYAQSELREIVFVELPKLGLFYKALECVSIVESLKAPSEIDAPVDGEVIEVNKLLTSQPELLNKEPYSNGWIFKLKVSDMSQIEDLLSSAEYNLQIGG